MSLLKKNRSRISLTRPMLLVRPDALSLTTRIDSSCIRYTWLLGNVALPFNPIELAIIYRLAEGMPLANFMSSLPSESIHALIQRMSGQDGSEAIISLLERLNPLESLQLIECIEAHLIQIGSSNEKIFESDGKRIYISDWMLKMLRDGETNLENRVSSVCIRYHWLKQLFTLAVDDECFDRLLAIKVRNKLLALNPKDIIDFYAYRLSNHFDLVALNNLSRWEVVGLIDRLEDAVIAQVELN